MINRKRTGRTAQAGISGLAAILALSFTACDKIDTKGGAASRELKTQKDSVSYGIGMDIGSSLKSQAFDAGTLELDKLKAGINDMLSGAKPAMTDSQMRMVLTAFQQRMMMRQDSVNKAKAETNQKAGEEFLAKNAKDSGVVVTPSGLQYKVLKEGTGKSPDSSAMVTVHYTGTLLDGTEFDSSVKRGQPATFPVTGVIPGWTEALLMMKEGAKWKLWIPASLGYGAQQRGPHISPNSTLVFEVELISAGGAGSQGGAADPHAGHGH
jgi:FKBP-type peptidyl-prolyl cis-trans isomerase FklB